VQYCLSLIFVFMKCPTNSEPFVTFTFSGFHKVKAFTGEADYDLQKLQWQ
jgi:hypothetical protein